MKPTLRVPDSATMNFRIQTHEAERGSWVIELAGEVDLYTAPELKQELIRIIDSGAKVVVVDLEETTFIDSTTLGVLLGAVKRLRPAGGSLLLVCSDRNIRKIFEITLLDRVFSIFETRAEALEQIPASAD
jgi:anti-sigma B factor antagonist